MKLPHDKEIIDRRDILCNAVSGKNVLHIGYSDAPFTKERLLKNELLHQRLEESASFLVGIDIDDQAIKMMKDNGISNVYTKSIYDLSSFNEVKKEFDYIVITEVLEHLVNPGIALEEVRKYIKKSNKSCKLLITVPNIHSYVRTVIDPLLNQESVHPDHVCYYSHSTLVKLLESSGFGIKYIRYVTYGLRPIGLAVASVLNIFSSSFLPSIYVLAEVKE